MTETDFKAELARGLSGAYIFYGEEDFMKLFYLKKLRSAIVSPDFEAFNSIVLSGENEILDKLETAMSTLPFMAQQKLIELHGLAPAEMSSDSFKRLCSMLLSSADYPNSVIVMYLMPDELPKSSGREQSAVLKSLSEAAKPVFFPFEERSKLVKWIGKHFSAEGISADPGLCTSLIDMCGREMFALSGEIDKLICYLKFHERSELSAEDLEQVVSRSPESGQFDFSNALLDGNSDRAFELLSDMKLRKERPELVLAGVSRIVSDMYQIKMLTSGGMTAREIASKLKMHEYKASLYVQNVARRSPERLRGALYMCYDTDVKLKSTSLDSYMLIERLAAAILARG